MSLHKTPEMLPNVTSLAHLPSDHLGVVIRMQTPGPHTRPTESESLGWVAGVEGGGGGGGTLDCALRLPCGDKHQMWEMALEQDSRNKCPS